MSSVNQFIPEPKFPEARPVELGGITLRFVGIDAARHFADVKDARAKFALVEERFNSGTTVTRINLAPVAHITSGDFKGMNYAEPSWDILIKALEAQGHACEFVPSRKPGWMMDLQLTKNDAPAK